MMRKAQLTDLNSIMNIIAETIKEMHSYNNYQWDENYPQSSDFTNDIEKGDLYVEDKNGQVAGFICINYIEPSEYNSLNWSSNEQSMVIHRMAVSSIYRNQGVATKLMNFAEELAISNGIKYLKTDTYSLNTKMNSLFKKFEFKLIGEINFLGKEKSFYCYEKLLSQ